MATKAVGTPGITADVVCRLIEVAFGSSRYRPSKAGLEKAKRKIEFLAYTVRKLKSDSGGYSPFRPGSLAYNDDGDIVMSLSELESAIRPSPRTRRRSPVWLGRALTLQPLIHAVVIEAGHERASPNAINGPVVKILRELLRAIDGKEVPLGTIQSALKRHRSRVHSALKET